MSDKHIVLSYIGSHRGRLIKQTNTMFISERLRFGACLTCTELKHARLQISTVLWEFDDIVQYRSVSGP